MQGLLRHSLNIFITVSVTVIIINHYQRNFFSLSLSPISSTHISAYEQASNLCLILYAFLLQVSSVAIFTNSLGQLMSHHWPSFSKAENKGSVLLWYSCFDRSILMFLMRERLQSQISILKHCLMRLWIDNNQLIFVFPFAETRSVDVNWLRESHQLCHH